jgi:hypothetical protein
MEAKTEITEVNVPLTEKDLKMIDFCHKTFMQNPLTQQDKVIIIRCALKEYYQSILNLVNQGNEHEGLPAIKSILEENNTTKSKTTNLKLLTKKTKSSVMNTQQSNQEKTTEKKEVVTINQSTLTNTDSKQAEDRVKVRQDGTTTSKEVKEVLAKRTKEDVMAHIIDKIGGIYKSEKGKKYITHIIREFLPAKYEVVESWVKPDGAKCGITNIQLISMEEAKKLAPVVKTVLEADKNHFIKGKKIAHSSRGSNAYLSSLSIECLNIFCLKEIEAGNKHMKLIYNTPNKPKETDTKTEKSTGVVSTESRVNKFENKYKNDSVGEKIFQNHKQQQPVNKQNTQKTIKPATFSLGDNDALSKLKSQLSENEKNKKDGKAKETGGSSETQRG